MKNASSLIKIERFLAESKERNMLSNNFNFIGYIYR